MRYRLPPKDVVEILDAPPVPLVSVSPNGEWMALGYQGNLPTMRELSAPMLRLAGRRINPRTNGLYTISPIIRLSVVNLEVGRERPVDGLEGRLGFPLWAPDGRAFACTRTVQDGIELWVVDPESARARQITEPALNGARGEPCHWMPDSTRLICHFVHEASGEPEEPDVPLGPIIQESSGKASPARTHQDLIEDSHDEALFDHYLTSQPALVDPGTGAREDLGPPGIYEVLEPSPSGEYFLAVSTVRPYSYVVPDHRFPKQVDVWDSGGAPFRSVARLPVDEKGPEHVGFRRDGARSFHWQAKRPATLSYLEALDHGDPRQQVRHRDRILLLESPFNGEPEELIRTEYRLGSTDFGRGPPLFWCADGETALVFEYDWATRRARSWVIAIGDREGGPDCLWDRSTEAWYEDPGQPLTTTTDHGEVVVQQQGDHIYLKGQGGSPEGDRPFLDRFNLRSRETERVFHCAPDCYEFAVALLDDAATEVLTRRETTTEPPNYHVLNTATGSRRQVTSFPPPQPQLEGITKKKISYQRDDGIALSGDLYLPACHQPGEPLPVLVWAYPREYADESGAGQVRGSPHRFIFLNGATHLALLTQGFAVLDHAAMPIVGGLRANDTYIAQLAANGEAAARELTRLGVADPRRIAIAGHSYGAFMTANMLAHSNVFCAGIARSGAFNRSLTPFGFQFERRSFWDAPEVYNQMSAFMHADKINEPLLLVHGMMDNNPGTFPIQSERLYHALAGLGASVRLVLLPNESHGYRARESVLHTVWEMLDWMNRHVKDRPVTTTP